jgi:hypothetical protein
MGTQPRRAQHAEIGGGDQMAGDLNLVGVIEESTPAARV